MQNNLKDKTVRINGNAYQVIQQFPSKDGKKETLVLTRDLQPYETVIDPKTIFDLGYVSYRDIGYGGEDSAAAWLTLTSLMKKQKAIKIATVGKAGIIYETELLVVGKSFLDPDTYLIRIETADEIQESKITKDDLIKSFLLLKEIKDARAKKEPYTRKKKMDDTIDKIIAQANAVSRNSKEELPEEFDKLFENMAKLFNTRGLYDR